MHCLTNINAFATHDTAIGMVVQKRVLIIAFCLFQKPLETFWLQTYLQELRQAL